MIHSPARVVRLMREAIATHGLDLAGLVVLTEAANGYYATTAVIAALGGAERVDAVARDSVYATVEEAERDTSALAEAAGVASRLRLVREPTPAVLAGADIVTNQGPLRPIDAARVGHLKPTSVIPLMFDAWEHRPAELDLEACDRRGVLVLGTDEAAPGLGIYDYIGPLALEALFRVGVEGVRSRVLVVEGSPFGPPIGRTLASLGAVVRVATDRDAAAVRAGGGTRVGGLKERVPSQWLPDLDAVIAAGGEDGPTIGGEFLPAAELVASGATVVEFLGAVDRQALRRHGVPVWPERELLPGHMGITTGELGPRACIDLSTASLQVAAVAARARQAGHSPAEAAGLAERRAPGQWIRPPGEESRRAGPD
jgi:hypothetical protein